ncbi:heavy metal-binding domain-containing protein [Mucilaginibacter lutimaris]|uniref:Heavy metal-binding domain-containing protein n=1 Tax=Mucilaginibacter lutimaris TaxID=931629 RepID=A0ABW2ZBX8_9SPHI
MRRSIIILAVAASLGFAACNSLATKDAKATEDAKPKGKYYCTMHPEITSDKPGTCSKCGMDLVERDTK